MNSSRRQHMALFVSEYLSEDSGDGVKIRSAKL